MQKQYVNGKLVDLDPNELKGVEQLKADAVKTDKKKWIMRSQMSYPPITDWLDGMVKDDQAQMDKYVADCLAVKKNNPKE